MRPLGSYQAQKDITKQAGTKEFTVSKGQIVSVSNSEYQSEAIYIETPEMGAWFHKSILKDFEYRD